MRSLGACAILHRFEASRHSVCPTDLALSCAARAHAPKPERREGVATGTLVDAGRADGSGHGALHVRLVVMVPALGGLAPPSRGGGKDPLPAPVAGRSGELPLDRFRQAD